MSIQQANRMLLLKLLAWGVGMFVFAIFIMPPIYDVFCEVTGLNGKTGSQYTPVSSEVDRSRSIRVQFIATNNETMPWQFKPMLQEIRVHPGEETEIRYFARNPTQSDMIGQAIPSVVPFKAAQYFHKTECFCFNYQPLLAGQSAELPLRFIVDQDIPKQIHTITLSYTMFDITETLGAENIIGLRNKVNTENKQEMLSHNIKIGAVAIISGR
ncbi:cytochrome c oxidase assembly protein [Marinibactrum halimedae]|uniref:Cytochrome c oxidase assembly protein CtaG n=1 Tax=Marinibactrum halimedae TaxID=1444977 RepID=A0AA37WM11_9GAMM|nr:cytochrome c oxidase assembly protein [Marinibactrum halimedae]MCD9461048.1 cytochrome c oxidase assembly protein [Marinibactrum halimedae]GLS24426.1 cytochrome c oxidase assembly protein [Marinibactrum halimedae]